MSFNTNWNIDKYKDSTEYEIHWKLRRSFMETHKNKYPEERLVALAKVFANMEFMGCMYNTELMLLVRNLARQVDEIITYREDKKTKVSRTFVKASDAVKRNNKSSKIIPNKKKKRKIEFEDSEDVIIQNKMPKIQDKKQEIEERLRNKMNKEDFKIFQKVKSQHGVKGKLIIYEKPGENEHNSLLRSTGKCHIKLQYTTNQIDGNTVHQLFLQDELMSQLTLNKKTNGVIRKKLSQMAMEELKKYCFTVIDNNQDFASVSKEDTEKKSPQKDTVDPTAMHSGIGAKIMKMMGWKGEGLGKNESGIQTPIEATVHLRKTGLGNNNSNAGFRSAIKRYLENYLKSDEQKPLQLSTEFTKEERKTIHEIVKKMPTLKSKSYGSEDNRHMRIEKNIEPWILVQELLKNSGKTTTHILQKPSALI